MTSDELEDYIYDCDYIAPDSPKPDYRYVVKLVLRVTLFFRDGHTASTRSALWTCFSDYFKAFGNHLQWGWDPLPKGADPNPWHFEERLANEVHQTLTTSPPDSEIDLAFYDSFNPKYVGNYGITCMTVPDWHQAKNVDGSYLSFWVAPDRLPTWHLGSGNVPDSRLCSGLLQSTECDSRLRGILPCFT
ncbi:hypothetical protein C7401_14342 [Paraburkholderia unamae]|uniref:hypothetical protein n=1 Tax=Paraburkholderia unamae TaxID=219649 RepID=UPI000DC5658D|nr:hypothetical protein [Paraburkholderia unamae]RAR50050.1 hypothetical protein C7401_14342 [Paraburkholderia unamae]